MRIVINHLTRMSPGYICVAGLDVENQQQVRPVLGANLTLSYLASKGGYFGLGHLLELERTQYVGRAPEVEDYKFEPGKVKRLSQMLPAPFWQLLKEVARPSLQTIFGPEFQQRGSHGVIKAGGGLASLGTLSVETSARLVVDNQHKLRLNFSDGVFNLDAPITDLRFYEGNQHSLKKDVVEQVADWCESRQPFILSVGLSRAWQKPGDAAAYHWLQINNLYWEQNPLWE